MPLQSEITRKFGSFHSSNIEEQLKDATTGAYVPPNFPVALPKFAPDTNKLKFGKSIKTAHFFLDDHVIFLNHGAFGSVLKEALTTLHQLQIYVEKEPVRFIDRELFPLIVHSQKRLSEFIGCDPTDIAFVENATMGTNVVLNSINFKDTDYVYYLNTAYGAVKKSLSQLHTKCGIQLQQENVALPISNEQEVVDLVRKTLLPGTKLAVFDHVPSNTAFTMPIKELIEVCHARSVPVLIDGAHALGAIHLNLHALNPDYYVSNAHKWFCAPKGCAFLYVKPVLQSNITALTVSHGYGYGFQSELTYSGLKDYTPYIALQCCIDFWNALGPDRISSEIKCLLYKAVEMLAKKWCGALLAPLEMHHTMCCVSLPKSLYEGKIVSYDMAEMIQNRLFHEHSIEVPVKCVADKLYVRISCHIYNEMKDYEKLADAVLSML